MYLALNNLQRLIYYKTQQTNQTGLVVTVRGPSMGQIELLNHLLMTLLIISYLKSYSCMQIGWVFFN